MDSGASVTSGIAGYMGYAIWNNRNCNIQATMKTMGEWLPTLFLAENGKLPGRAFDMDTQKRRGKQSPSAKPRSRSP